MSKMKELDEIAQGVADVTMELMYDSGPNMEALKLKIENLEWEMNRLDSENKKLREQYPE